MLNKLESGQLIELQWEYWYPPTGFAPRRIQILLLNRYGTHKNDDQNRGWNGIILYDSINPNEELLPQTKQYPDIWLASSMKENKLLILSEAK
tara:strand:+ start:106 stop:384 length:279 start_codon:yes stop_codon:yes gene_type:complete